MTFDAIDRAMGVAPARDITDPNPPRPAWEPPPVVFSDPCWRVLFTQPEATRLLTLVAAAHVAGIPYESVDRLIVGKLREVGK